jgi:hypothetical protein
MNGDVKPGVPPVPGLGVLLSGASPLLLDLEMARQGQAAERALLEYLRPLVRFMRPPVSIGGVSRPGG